MSDLTNQYIIAQEEHDYNKKYEKGTIVKHTIGDITTAYVAKQNVPRFVSILDEHYWKKLGSIGSHNIGDNYLKAGEYESTASVDFDAFADTVHNIQQTLSSSQKQQARQNINAISGGDLKTLNGQSLVGSGNIDIEIYFKGIYLITDTLPTGQAGDYIYVVDSATPPVTHVYTWNGIAFADSGETVTMGDSQFANSTKPISQTNVVNDLTTGGVDDVLSAEQGKVLNLFVPKNLTEEQKTNVRMNIDAVKQEYQLVEHSNVYYTGEYVTNGTKVESNVNKLKQYNVFDKANFKRGYRMNDSGEEVSDSAEGYVTTLIPAKGGCIVISNCNIAKCYEFDVNGDFIVRATGTNAYSIMRIQDSNNIGFITFQIKQSYLDTVGIDNVMIAMAPYSTTGTIAVSQSYIPYSLKQGGIIVEPNTILWKDDFSSFNVYTAKQIGGTSTIIQNEVLFVDINPWEPATADSGYSSPSTGSGGVTRREDWTAEDKYSYYEFLEHYYDTYLGYYNNGNYRVTKKGLWQDGAHTGHEIFEYDFCPINYKYTVMLSAGMNADETQGIWGLATFVRCLMNEEEPNMTIMKQNIRFKIIPIINASGFDQESLRYTYSNGVNPNYNFNYKDSWSRNTKTLAQKGEYPDSNIETQELKKWINEHSGIAQLYIDMHTGRFQQNNDPVATDTIILDVRFGNESSYNQSFNTVHKPLIQQFYINKGYITDSDEIGNASTVSDNINYQKQTYAVQVCGINSAMPEMHLESTGYGSDGLTNNSVEGIKGYVLQLRQIIMFVINKYITDTVQSANIVDVDILRFRK